MFLWYWHSQLHFVLPQGTQFSSMISLMLNSSIIKASSAELIDKFECYVDLFIFLNWLSSFTCRCHYYSSYRESHSHCLLQLKNSIKIMIKINSIKVKTFDRSFMKKKCEIWMTFFTVIRIHSASSHLWWGLVVQGAAECRLRLVAVWVLFEAVWLA